MTNGENQGGEPRVPTRPLLAGAVLVGLGSLITLTGLALSGATLAAAVRRWVNERDIPPGEVMKQQVAKAKAATAAGASAWRDQASASG